jgi:GDP-L-fucose synthase
VNIGLGKDSTISELASLIRDTVGSGAKIVYDRSKPDGTPQKLLDIGLLRSLGWQPRVRLADGLRLAYANFLEASPAAIGT